MSRLIDFGKQFGVVSFPDDATDEQIVSQYGELQSRVTPPPSASQIAQQVGRNLIQGAGGTLASIPEGISRLRDSAQSILPESLAPYYRAVSRAVSGAVDPTAIVDQASDLLGTPKLSQLLRGTGSLIRRGTEAISPAPVKELEDSFLATDLPKGIGSALAFIVGGVAGASAKVPVWLTSSSMGAGIGAEGFYQDAIQSGADERTAHISSLVGGAVGTSEALGIGKIANRLDKISGNTFSRALINAGKETFEEAVQEAGQQLAQNLTAQQLYDKDRDLYEGVVNNAGVGGATGFLLSTLASALGAGRQRGTRTPSDSASEERIKQVLAERESPNGQIQSTEIKVTPQGQEAGIIPAQDGLEAQRKIPITSLQSALSGITANWQNAPLMQVVQRQEELPPDVQNYIKTISGDVSGGIPAAKDAQGKVWFVANNIANEEHAKRLLLHEAVGHLGVRGIIQDQRAFEQFMAGVAERHADTQIGREVRQIYGDDSVLVGEEVVAKLAENPGADPNLWQQIVAAVRSWVRNVFNIEVSDNDIKVLLSKAKAKVQQGQLNSVASVASQPRLAGDSLPDAPVVYKGHQPGFGTIAGFDLYNLTDTISPTLVKGSTVTGDSLRKAGFKVPVSEEAKAQAARPSTEGQEPRLAVNPPSFFETRQQVNAATASPGLTPDQIQEAEDLASVQSSMVTDAMKGFLLQTPTSDFQVVAQDLLDYLSDRMYLSQSPRPLSSLPVGTTAEQLAKEVAGTMQLAHYGVDRAKEQQINNNLQVDQLRMTELVTKLPKMNNANLKASFLEAMFKGVVSEYKAYLVNLSKAEPAAQNLQAAWRARLNLGQERLNNQEQSPTALKHALSAIASQISDTLLATGNNQSIIDWTLQQGIMFDVVSDTVSDWMLVDDGTGSPAMEKYTRLIPDLVVLRDILTKQQEVGADIDAFEQWFRPSGTTGGVSDKQFAERYFKFRTGRDRAVKIASSIDKEIGDLDTRIRGNKDALDRLQQMMADKAYVDTVNEATKIADVVVRAITDVYGTGKATGLIDRESNEGLHKLKGPISGTDYIVDLFPSSAQEATNISNLSKYVVEARDFANNNANTNPVLAGEYGKLADYIERYLMNPSFNPSNGFTQLPYINIIPGTSIRLVPDPFEWLNYATSAVSFHTGTIRDTLERVGGRTATQAIKDAYELDRVMRRVTFLEAEPRFGFEAQTKAVLAALASHGWAKDQFPMWDQDIAERVIASAQNRLSPEYEAGDYTVGTRLRITREDIAAIKLMKEFEDAVLKAAPAHIQGEIADLGILRKAVGNGKFTMARIAATWTRDFVSDFVKATTDADKIALLSKDIHFRNVVMGYIGEFNSEFNLMNSASATKAGLFDIYRQMALTEKQGIAFFNNWTQAIDFIANEIVGRGLAVDYVTARKRAEESLLSEINGFTEAFNREVLGKQKTQVWGAVPEKLVQVLSANNSFTSPRGNLMAPSTFYTYSIADDGRRRVHVGQLRSLMNLKVLQSLFDGYKALQNGMTKMQAQIQELVRSGMSQRKAERRVVKQTMAERKSGKIRYDYMELNAAIKSMSEIINSLEDMELGQAETYKHPGIEAINTASGMLKAGLLAGPQAITTNTFGGMLLGPALVHWQTGQWIKAYRDVAPFFLGGTTRVTGTLLKQLSYLAANNPMMKRLLNKHAPLWDELANLVLEASQDWARARHIAQLSGMVAPYNLRKKWENASKLKGTAGRLVTENSPGVVAKLFNSIISAPIVRHVSEPFRAYIPRVFDEFINYTLIFGFEKDLDYLKQRGYVAFQAREAASPSTYADLTNQSNVLTPEELGAGSMKALSRMRDLFAPVGSLDAVLLDYYQKTKTMTPEERENTPLITDETDMAGLALYNASVTNVATETNRPHAFRGRGSEGLLRSTIGTFAGWTANFMRQLSKAIQTHSGDSKYQQIGTTMVTIALAVALMTAVGAWNWEFGDELKRKITGAGSARIQSKAATEDIRSAVGYLAQALVNVVPLSGPILGAAAGVATTGRGNWFDMTSQILHLNMVSDTYNTAKRMFQTGDVTLPMADWTRRWVFPPVSQAIINRLPTMRGLLDQQNAIRALSGSALPGTEIKQGMAGREIRYGPANDEIQRLIASAYEATAHGGSQEQVQIAMQEAIAAYVRAGRTPEDAEKAVAVALAAKEPVRVLTGREMTPEEEYKWLKRMNPEQKADYDRAKNAWLLLSLATGKDFNMVSTGRSGGGGGGGIAGLPSALPGRGIGLPSALPVMSSGGGGGGSSPILRVSRRSGAGRSRRLRIGRGRRTLLRTPRRRSPSIITSRRLGTRRRVGYASV